MDGLLVVFAIIMWIVAQSNKKNKKNKTAARAKQRNAAQRTADLRSQVYAEIKKRQTEITDHQSLRNEQHVFGEGMSGYLHTSPKELETQYSGSLQVESMEGECICDPELEHTREEQPETEGVYAEEIGREPLVDLSAWGVLQGFVMCEILKRPTQRTRYH